MTRGKFIFILSYDTFLVSEEYNGDMYLNYSDDGTRILCNNAIGSFLNYFLDKFKDSKRILYKEMQEALVGEEVKNYGFARMFLDKFNELYFEQENLFFNALLSKTDNGEHFLDFTGDYIKKWFSDYIYVINLSKESNEIYFEDEGSEEVKKLKIFPNEVVQLYFGSEAKKITTFDFI